MPPKHIYLIAGEASGDFLGAQLMKALRNQSDELIFSGIGGPLMQAEGLKSLFPMDELSLMGIWEIAPKLKSLLKRIKQTIEDIRIKRPDIVVTIDAPDFSFRVMKGVRNRVTSPPELIHYVAPTVWAWRPKRAKKIAQFLDGLICLFDFEPAYFEKEGLEAIAVGHPMMESGIVEAQKIQIGKTDTKKLGVFFGSRQGEIKRVAPVLLETIDKLIKENENLELIIPTLPYLEAQIRSILKDMEVPVHIMTGSTQKWSVFKACDVAIAVSGTVGLELAAANVPHVIAYKMNPLTWQIVKRVIQTKYAHLANIIGGREIVPEFIQDNCVTEKIAPVVKALLDNPQKRQKQQQAFEAVRQSIGGEQRPSKTAAEFLLRQ